MVRHGETEWSRDGRHTGLTDLPEWDYCDYERRHPAEIAAVFTHGAFASVLAERWIGLPVVEGAHFCLGPAALAILRDRSGYPDIAAILLWNVTCRPKIAA